MYEKNKIGIFKIPIIFLIITILFSGCTSEIAKKSIPKVNLPEKEQVKNITKYSDTLRCMDTLYKISDDGSEPIRVYINNIQNETANKAKLPSNFKTMLITAFNKLGSSIVVVNNREDAYFIVNAAITEFDFSSSEGAGVYFGGSGGKGKGETDGDGRGGYKREIQTMAIDFNLINKTESIEKYEPYVSTSYKMELIKIEDSNDWGISIYGNGFGMNANITKAQGIHAGIRLLLQISLTELFGELNILPYWECRGGRYDREFEDRLDYYYKKNKAYLPQIIAPSLIQRGLLEVNGDLENAIIKYKTINNINPINSKITRELFFKLFTTVPTKDHTNEGKRLDLFSKYTSVDDIKIYAKALNKEQELKKETYFEQRKKIDSLYRLFKKEERLNPNINLYITSIVPKEENINNSKKNLKLLSAKLMQKGILRKQIRELSKKSIIKCQYDNKCKFNNNYLKFEIY